MFTINDGGAAFPGKICTGHTAGDEEPIYQHPPGMTLRDWFAGMALKGVLRGQVEAWKEGRTLTDKTSSAEAASIAYQLADAMLKTREGK